MRLRPRWLAPLAVLVLPLTVGALAPAVPGLSPPGRAQLDGSVRPADTWTCPASHPVKAVVSPLTRECVYHVPGGQHHTATRPEMCFASEEDARQEDCWRAEEVL